MKLKKDWTWAHFLYYLTLIGCTLLILSIFSNLFTFYSFKQEGKFVVLDIPVTINTKQSEILEKVETENLRINLPHRIHTIIDVYTDRKNLSFSAYYLYLVTFFKKTLDIAFLFILSRLLKNVANSQPFHSKNLHYLFYMGWILIVTSAIHTVLQYLPIPYISDLTFSSGIQISSLRVFGGDFFLGGILVIVLGYVFKEGARIHQEQKLTV